MKSTTILVAFTALLAVQFAYTQDYEGEGESEVDSNVVEDGDGGDRTLEACHALVNNRALLPDDTMTFAENTYAAFKRACNAHGEFRFSKGIFEKYISKHVHQLQSVLTDNACDSVHELHIESNCQKIQLPGGLN